MQVIQKRIGWTLATIVIVLSAFPRMALSESPVQSVEVVTRFVESYNHHDVEQMLADCSDDVRWLTVTDDELIVEASGKDMLRSAMNAHFESNPDTRSVLLAVEGDGPMVVAIEKALSGSRDSARSQCSASVYELKDSLINNVWYFDVYRCGQPGD